MSTIISAGLVQSRHDMPVTRFVFSSIPDPLDFAGMEDEAMRFVQAYKLGGFDPYISTREGPELELYVTGLTAALVAVLNACQRAGVRAVTLRHFDRDTGEYARQPVYMPVKAPYGY